MGDVSLWAVFSCDGCMAARREGASRGDNTSGSVYTTCFSWSTSITTAPSSKERGTWVKRGRGQTALNYGPATRKNRNGWY